MMQYNTRLNGLQVQIQRSQMLGEKDRVVFIWKPETKFPLTDKQVEQIENNCKKYIVAQGLANKLYPITDEDKVAIELPPSNRGRYVTVAQALKGEF